MFDVLDLSDVGLVIVDRAGHVVWANETVARFFGLRREDLLGEDGRTLVREQLGDRIEDPEGLQTALTTADTSTSQPRVRMHVLPGEGRPGEGREERWLERTSRPITTGPYAGGRLEHYHDVSEGVRAEAALAGRAREAALSVAVGTALTRGGPFREVLQRCAEALVEHLGAAFARIWTLDERQEVLELQASAGLYTHLDGGHSRVPVGAFKIGKIAAQGEPHLTNEVLTDPQVSDKAWARREGMKAFAGYPLLVEGQVVGVMAIFSRHSLSEATLNVLGAVADGVAVATERHRGLEALRASEERYRTIFDQTYTFLGVTTPEGVLIDVNRAALEAGGFAREDVLGRPLWDTPWLENLPEEQAALKEDVAAAVRGHSAHATATFLTASGERRLVDRTLTPVTDEAGRVRLVMASGQDITERRRAEAELTESAERLRFLADAMPQKVWTADAQGRITSVNRRWLDYTGLGLAALRDWGWKRIIHPDDWAENLRAWRRSIDTGEDFELEHRFRRADGVYRWHLSRGLAQRSEGGGEGGEVLMWVGTNTDIHEQKQTEEALYRHAQQLRSLAAASLAINAASSPEGVLQLVAEQARLVIGAHQAVTSLSADQDGRQARNQDGAQSINTINTVSLSEAYASYRGYEGVAEDSGIYRLVCEEKRPMRLTRAELEAHPAWRGFGEQAAHPPLHGWLAAPLMDRSGGNLGLIQLFDKLAGDFDENDENILMQLAQIAAVAVQNARLYDEAQRLNEELERRVRQRTEELAQSNRELSAFADAISHDLRAPLSVMSGFSQVLVEDYGEKLDGVGKTYLERILRNAARMGRLIDDLLKLSKVSRQDLELEPVALCGLLRGIHDALKSRYPACRPRFRCARDFTVSADSGLLLIALENLMDNAWKFSAQRGDAAITFGLSQEEGETVFRLRDNGVGFDMAYAEQLFQPFHRLHSAKDFAGTGIGLVTVRRIIERHGGRIWVESRPGEGTTFFFTLPAETDPARS